MCGRFFREGVSWAEYHAWLNIIEIHGVEPPEANWNIAPTTIQPVIRLNHDRSAREMAPMRWGLIPSWWSKPIREWQAASINARAEEVAQKPTFRGAYRHKRCLVPVSGYYEWSVQGKTKTPFAFRLHNRRLFCLAGLWDAALIDGSEIQSFTILTTKPNDFTAGIHDRMPVILRPEDYDRWLDPASGDPSDLFEPFPNEDMDAWPIGPAVGKVSNNYPGLLDDV
ncbi:SOS response-associated peptidase [Hyphomonas sp.]|uniref:SOS response-associated peptidase n=1 Tax=Hyphomonas sp. TaxID=87 RepID=UPI001BCF7919|nr:SOS response-associated peptidase [Hyphomonas sp.]